MEDRVRELDQIREEPAGTQRKLALPAIGAAALFALLSAVAIAMQRASSPALQSDDPLATLAHAATEAPQGAPYIKAPDPASMDVSQLSFPSTLADSEDRPEVTAALKAAEAEEASLADSSAGGATRSDRSRIAELLMPQAMVARVPAAVAAASAGRSLRKAARQDPLMAAAIRAQSPKGAVAPEGRQGDFTLHVISYERSEVARGFASGLRARGHPAFVVSGDVPERGRSFRVRIGPFKTRSQAEAYRRRFETEEHMNTVVLWDTAAAE
jgi:cell division septation protein DedD